MNETGKVEHMTPAQKLGYAVGDAFVVVTDDSNFQLFSVVTLLEDDGTDLPLFIGLDEDGDEVEEFLDIEMDIEPYTGDNAFCTCQQPLSFDLDSDEDGTTISFHTQLTASQIGRILAIAEEA